MTVRRPSSTKIERAKWIALRTEQTIPEGALGDDKELSAWIKIHDPASDNQIKQIKRWIASGKIEVPPRYPHAMTAAEARRIIAANRPARTRGEQRQARRKLPWLAGKLLWLWLWIGVAVPMIVGVFIPLFLPSKEWAALMSIPSVAIGLVSAAIYVLVLRAYREIRDDYPIIVGGAALLAFAAGRNIAILIVPMIFPLFIGAHVELPYMVVQIDGFESKGCRRPIKLEGMPLMFRELCGFPDSFRHSLAPGMRLSVAGYGTRYGLYVENARPADPVSTDGPKQLRGAPD
ncbi:hypothetical protein PY650_10915 [Rhizobium calliandrae]|uniref:DUF4339 domain-containing protein n=1 Tax=Rhizobium calliandrae TaxID=1312182 RepID=A0ABT7KC20_9HYPH|nr:hypothetical protein [Rhizobium calliandrae]MDL2406170.1 hypothetical protein [Rhizobium calliandrae]